MTPTDPRVAPLPFAVFDEFGKPADDRVQDHIRAALSEALGDSQPVADESMRDLVDLPIIGAVPRKYIGDEAILALQRMAASIGIVNRVACWDHMAMFELRDLIVDRAIAAQAKEAAQRTEPASVQAPDVDSRFQEAMSAADQSARGCIDDGKRNYIFQTARNAWNKSRPETPIVREPLAEIERHARRIHELMCQANLIGGMAATCSFNGWTADGRAVRHTIKTDGYERTGPKVEKERAVLAANPSTDQNHSG